MAEPVIIEAIRTPFAKRGGAFREQRPDALLASLLRSLINRSGVDARQVEDVVTGCVSSRRRMSGGSPGCSPACQSRRPAFTLNRMCGSGQTAVHIAAQEVAAGDGRYTIGCGVESMSRVPMFLDVTLGAQFRDWSCLNPDLLDRHDLIHQGESAERVAERWQISRAELDTFARDSHRRAHAAAIARKNREIVATERCGASGSTTR